MARREDETTWTAAWGDHAHEWQVALHNLHQASDHYDTQTAHGQHTSTIIDVSIGEVAACE